MTLCVLHILAHIARGKFYGKEKAARFKREMTKFNLKYIHGMQGKLNLKVYTIESITKMEIQPPFNFTNLFLAGNSGIILSSPFCVIILGIITFTRHTNIFQANI